MTIHIQNLHFQCIIGILDFERTREQDVIIDALIEYNYNDEFIDYALVSDFIQTEMNTQKFMLIEQALSCIMKKLKENFPLISQLNLKITKPSILPNARVSVSNSISFES